jgi:hypothetical protein
MLSDPRYSKLRFFSHYSSGDQTYKSMMIELVVNIFAGVPDIAFSIKLE